MRAVVLLLLAFVALCRADCDATTFLGGKFARCFTLNPEYDMYWTISGEDVTIGLNLRGYTDPWVGLGISVNGGMMGADIALTRIVGGKYTLEDRFATQFAQPAVDTLQNLKLISASSVNQETTIVYSRKLVPCDVDQDQPILANVTQVIYAYGIGDFAYHGPFHRGTAIVSFHFVPVQLPLPATYQVVNVTIPPYNMPANETTYVCVSQILPNDQKYHVIRWRPIIQTPEHIHHMVIFGCILNPNTTVPYECPMAPATAYCSTVIVAWTIGQTGNDFLGDYALPIGKGVQTGSYVVLQIHYNNPELQTGVVDASGISLTYTTELRANDVGTVPMSTPTQLLVLPPAQKEVYHYTRCHQECISKSIPATGITIINWFPHLHQLGSKIWLSHIRNGVELPEIHRDNHYDFARQQNFPVYRTIFPGDSLIMNCVWDTSARTLPVYGGEATTQEMCIGIFQYYPATSPVKFGRCTDLHEDFNTTGNDPSWAVCSANDRYAVDPTNNKNTSVTAVIANPAYTPLAPKKSTCDDFSAATSTAVVSLITYLSFVVFCML